MKEIKKTSFINRNNITFTCVLTEDKKTPWSRNTYYAKLYVNNKYFLTSKPLSKTNVNTIKEATNFEKILSTFIFGDKIKIDDKRIFKLINEIYY